MYSTVDFEVCFGSISIVESILSLILAFTQMASSWCPKFAEIFFNPFSPLLGKCSLGHWVQYNLSNTTYLFIVEWYTTTPVSVRSFWRDHAVKRGSWFAILTILWAVLLYIWVLSDIFLGLSVLALTSTVPDDCHFLSKFQTEDIENIWKRFAIFSCFVSVGCFQFQCSRQLLRRTHGADCWSKFRWV